MADGRRAEAWDRTALVCSLLANPHRNARERPDPYTPHDFMPSRYRNPAQARQAAEAKVIKLPLSALRDLMRV